MSSEIGLALMARCFGLGGHGKQRPALQVAPLPVLVAVMSQGLAQGVVQLSDAHPVGSTAFELRQREELRSHVDGQAVVAWGISWQCTLQVPFAVEHTNFKYMGPACELIQRIFAQLLQMRVVGGPALARSFRVRRPPPSELSEVRRPTWPTRERG